MFTAMLVLLSVASVGLIVAKWTERPASPVVGYRWVRV